MGAFLAEMKKMSRRSPVVTGPDGRGNETCGTEPKDLASVGARLAAMADEVDEIARALYPQTNTRLLVFRDYAATAAVDLRHAARMAGWK